ncbi:17299_t:CDS:2, partial [Funneliformis geosporum]
YKIKTNNLNILLGTSYYFEAGRYKNHYYYDEALKNYKIALMNEPKHYLCLKSCAHIYKIQERYLEALEMLDKILEINQDDSLILCYYGEILNYLGRYKDSIYHFTRAYNIDPENSHILINKAIIHYELQEYNKALLDINKSIHLISSNSFAYFFKGLIYYALGNHYSARIEVERCKSFFDANDNLAKFLIDYLKHLLSINESSTLNHRDISLVYLVQEYSNSKLWTFLLKYFKVNDDYFSEIGIINKFHKLMYKEKGVYFTSNLTNLNKEFLRFQESDSNSLSNQVLSFKDEVLPVILPKLFDNVIRFFLYYVTWKINVKKLLSKDCYVEFIVEIIDIYSNLTKCHKLTLTYENLSELIGLGWIEYTLPFEVNKWAQPSIILKDNSIIMQVDYVRLMPNKRDTVYVPKMNEPLPINKFYPNVPEAFNDKYFSKKEMETLIELKDIIN